MERADCSGFHTLSRTEGGVTGIWKILVLWSGCSQRHMVMADRAEGSVLVSEELADFADFVNLANIQATMPRARRASDLGTAAQMASRGLRAGTDPFQSSLVRW